MQYKHCGFKRNIGKCDVKQMHYVVSKQLKCDDNE